MNTTLRLSHQKVKIADTDAAEFTPDALTLLFGELKDALASDPEPTNKEQKKVLH